MATTEPSLNSPTPSEKDLWTTVWDNIYYAERALKTARGGLFFVALAFAATRRMGIGVRTANWVRSAVSDIRYVILAIMVAGDTGNLARGELLSGDKSSLANARDLFYYIVDGATLLLFMNDKLPFIKLTPTAASRTWRYLSTFWVAGSAAGLAETIRESDSDPKRQDQGSFRRLANRNTLVAMADLVYSVGVVGEAPGTLTETAAVIGGIRLWPEKKETSNDA